jgi:hypothetical protein
MVVLVVVGACSRDGLGLNLGVEPNELGRVAFDSAYVSGDLGAIHCCTVAYVWWTTRSLTACPAQMRAASATMAAVRASSFLCVVWTLWSVCVCVVLDGCGKWSSY